MDPHRLAEKRSLAFHSAIATRLRHDPAVLQRAQERVVSWLAVGPAAPRYALAWQQVLAADVATIEEFLTDASEHATELRQSSPFAGELAPRERWRLWRTVAETMVDET